MWNIQQECNQLQTNKVFLRPYILDTIMCPHPCLVLPVTSLRCHCPTLFEMCERGVCYNHQRDSHVLILTVRILAVV